MPKEQKQAARPSEEVSRGRETNSAIGKHVMGTLGTPDNLQRVDVWRLWGAHYRVNIFVSLGVASSRIAHSYFIVTDDKGEVVETTPRIVRLY